MNHILKLSGNKFTQESRAGSMGGISIPKNSEVTLQKLQSIHESLLKLKEYWQDKQIINGILVSVYYDRIVAKSNRMQGYFRSQKAPNDSIVGAKFDASQTKHIITHYVSRDILNKTIKMSSEVIELFSRNFSSEVLNKKQFDDVEIFNKINYDDYTLSKTIFKQYLRDSVFIEKFDIEYVKQEDLKRSIITFYDVKENIQAVLKKIDIDVAMSDILNDTTVLLDAKNISLLLMKAPYLVSMAVEDFSVLNPDDFYMQGHEVAYSLPEPTNEPWIGVIDTLFDERVYFSKWVEYHEMVAKDIPREAKDYRHGTAVTSLIVDGANLNRRLDDGCGHFRVKHFGVALHSGFNSFTIIKQIEEIISQHREIKVWNLSLGSNEEIRENFVSIEAALLDDIQAEYDVIFIIAGTNSNKKGSVREKIGAPADSLNSIIVNSVDFNNQPADYTRTGVVLSFFIKPDVAYYGGGNGHFINVCEPLGLAQVAGTSYAAPFIARKIAYLIYIIGLSREEAKALLIDSAIGWHQNHTFEELTLIGMGIVPINIQDILSTPDDEIKFIISDISEKYNSYNYNFPVPISQDKYPYVAKATMCYFPKCSRNQGVDYTNTELNLIFGRLKPNGKEIHAINNDNQNTEDAPGYIRETTARNMFRKWDNVKHVREAFTPRSRAKKIINIDNPQWGMSVKTIERLQKRDGQGIRFGVVVTLKEINGKNRIEDFINRAQLRGWLIEQLQVEAKIDIYNKLTEEIEWE